MQRIIKLWYSPHKSLYYLLLLPFSWLYRLIVIARRYLYRWGWLSSYRFPVPIIVVGNLTVGGTGKTPLVIAVVNYLKSNGYKPGIVSRGYGGNATQYPILVSAQSDPFRVGDEAVLIAQQTGCPVAVAPARHQAVELLLDDHQCNIIVSDDGLQHYALHRDMEIMVIDGERRFGNGLLLPAGPLREPIARAKHVDMIVSNGEALVGEYEMQLIAQDFLRVFDQAVGLPDLEGRCMHAIAGIGHPQRFFKTLSQQGFQFVPHVFADHHQFSKKDLEFGDAVVMMTAKDAVKCQAFAHANCYYLSVAAQLPEEFWQVFTNKLNSF